MWISSKLFSISFYSKQFVNRSEKKALIAQNVSARTNRSIIDFFSLVRRSTPNENCSFHVDSGSLLSFQSQISINNENFASLLSHTLIFQLIVEQFGEEKTTHIKYVERKSYRLI